MLTAASEAPWSRNRIWSTASLAIWRRLICPALYIARPKWYALEPAISVRSRSKKAAAVRTTSAISQARWRASGSSQERFALDDPDDASADAWPVVLDR